MNISTLRAGEIPGTYVVTEPITEQEFLRLAKLMAKRRLRRGSKISTPEEVHRCLQTLLMDYEHEVFGLLMLDNRHRIIQFTEMFRGTINSASVYPREIVKEALSQNAAAVILVHNHPSGDPEPSQADQQITQRIKQALDTVDVRVLDHVVVGHEGVVSFAARGWF